MKKTALAVIVLISFGSCVKNYSCSCTYSTNSPGIKDSTTTAQLKGTKKDVVKNDCESGTYIFDQNGQKVSIVCKLN